MAEEAAFHWGIPFMSALLKASLFSRGQKKQGGGRETQTFIISSHHLGLKYNIQILV